MNCDEVRTQMQKALDGRLYDKEREMLQLHLSACQECSDAYSLLVKSSNRFKNYPVPLASENFTSAVMMKVQALHSDAAPQNGEIFRRLFVQYHLQCVAALAACVVAVLLILLCTLPPHHKLTLLDSKIVDNLPLYENLELLQDLELLADYEVIESLDDQRQVLREKASALSEDQLNELKKREKTFNALPTAEQERIRENYQEFKALDADQQALLRERHRKFRELPDDKRNEIRVRVRAGLNRQGVYPRGPKSVAAHLRSGVSTNAPGVGPKGGIFHRKPRNEKPLIKRNIPGVEDTSDIKVFSDNVNKFRHGKEKLKNTDR